MMATVIDKLEYATMTDITTLVKSIQSKHPPSEEAVGAEIKRIAKYAGRVDGEIASLAINQLHRRATRSELRAIESHDCYEKLLRLRDTL